MSSRVSCQRRQHYRILAVSDNVEPRLYGPQLRAIAGDVDFIAGCGDLPYYYLDYIISILNRPLCYVHGNHDRPEHRSDRSVVDEPPGGLNLHLRLHCVEGLLIAGLEGSHRYNKSYLYQYTQNDMWGHVLRLAPTFLLHRILHGRFLDILIAHSPPYSIHDATDPTHIGFRAFLPLMRWFKPRYLLHGHIHLYNTSTVTRTQYAETEVINVYPYRILDLEFPTN